MKLSVVLPVYNESGNLEKLNERLKKVLVGRYDYEIIYVDDRSTDGSFKILSKLHKADKRVKVVKFWKNFGQTASMRAGFDYASGDVIVSMDSDLQNDPRDIPALVDKIGSGYDCVVGWRYNRKDSFFKKYISVFARFLRKRVLGTKLHDYGCSLKAYTSTCAKDLDITGDMHRYIPPILSWKGYRIGEVKVMHHPRVEGKTKYGVSRIFKGFVDMFSVWFWKKYSTRPLHIFGGLGIVFGGLGFIFGVYALYKRIFLSVDLSSTFLPVLSVFFVMVGVQLFVSGILADIAVKSYNKSSGHKPYTIEKVLK